MKETLVAAEAWLAPIARLMRQLLSAAKDVFQTLWPGQPVPKEQSQLAQWMITAPKGIDN